MKVVFSRKSWDSGFGGKPNPIIQGQLIHLPIPYQPGLPWRQITSPHLQSLGFPDLDSFLKIYHPKLLSTEPYAHLDPDLVATSCANRLPGWCPAFGQDAAAASHLDNQGVGVGSLFLFYGWADDYDLPTRKFSHSDRFVLWGWLQVGEIFRSPTTANTPAWLHPHPHVAHGASWRNNRVYVARDKLLIGGEEIVLPGQPFPGGGVLPYKSSRDLTMVPGHRGMRPDKIPSGLVMTKQRQEHVWTAQTPADFTFIRSLLT